MPFVFRPPARKWLALQAFAEANDPEWKIVHRVAKSHQEALAEGIVAAFAAARRAIDEDTVTLELTKQGNTGQIEWDVLAKRLADTLAQHIRKVASQTALELLPRFRADYISPTEQFGELYQFWANNATAGKKGFQPTGGEVVSKDWKDPPPAIGQAGERKAGGYSSEDAYGTNTAFGRVGERAFVDIAGGKVLHPPGKGEQSPLDVRIDGYGFEVKAVSTRSTKYAATPKSYEIAQKEAYAKKLGVKTATAIVVVDSAAGQAHAYWRPGLATGRLSRSTGWKYLGSAPLGTAKFSEPLTFADPLDRSFESMNLVLRHSAAEDYLRTHLPTLVTNVTTETQEAIRDTILDGFQNGRPPREMARQIKTMVGMTRAQGQTALRMAHNWSDQGKKPAWIGDQLVAYRDKAVRYRAFNIARTETLRAANAGQQALWDAATNEGLLQRDVTKREWIATPSERTCPWCMALDGVEVGMNEAFRSGLGDVSMPPLHPSCRCAMGIAIDTGARAPAEAARLVGPEIDYVRDYDKISKSVVRSQAARMATDSGLEEWATTWQSAPSYQTTRVLRGYSNTAYDETNTVLRRDKGGGRVLVDTMDNAMTPIPRDVIVYRGTTKSAFRDVVGVDITAENPDLAPAKGQLVVDWGFMSTSFLKDKFRNRINLTILAPKGTRAFHMNAYGTSDFAHEEELLLARGTKLQIINVRHLGTQTGFAWFVDAVVVPD